MQRITEQKINWGVNVDSGYTGFISRKRDFIAKGINWFSRWSDVPGVPPVSHALLIVGINDTIEAFFDGVKHGKLTDYLHDPDVALIVRKPHKWSPEIAIALCAEAEKHVGEKYNYPLIAALAVANTFVGHALNSLTKNWFENFVTRMANAKGYAICSQTVARVMRSWYGNFGVLQQPDRAITPEELLADIFLYDGQPVELLPP